MSAEAVRSAIGEDGIQIAVDTLKGIAASTGGFDVEHETRLKAATTLLHYGLAFVDDFGNAVTG